jgi:hypothetical protein
MTAYFEQIKIFLLPPCGLVQPKVAADRNSRSFWADFGVMKSFVLFFSVA